MEASVVPLVACFFGASLIPLRLGISIRSAAEKLRVHAEDWMTYLASFGGILMPALSVLFVKPTLCTFIIISASLNVIYVLNLVFVPILAIFGILEWIIIFLETYRHFPKMEKQKRIRNSVYDATIMTVFLTAILYFFMYLMLKILQF